MKKVILIDGNNLIYRSYYATMYSGAGMKSNSNLPTNAVLAFVNMINKIVAEEKPNYMMIAFDKGKTFRHESYPDYKGGRLTMPDDLKVQFPMVKKIIELMNIKSLEIESYEADDIIGTFCKQIDNSTGYTGKIVSSDKDLLQLVSDKVSIKLLKQSDYLMIDNNNFVETFGIKPINIIDLKALQGDSSDNIPGVKGIGEKTAIKLLSEYTTIENLYDNIENIKGATYTKLTTDKENAYLSKQLATIYTKVPMDITLEDLSYTKEVNEQLIEYYKELNFTSLLKGISTINITKQEYVLIDDINKLKLNEECSLFLELDNSNYHNASIIGASVLSDNISYYIPFNIFKDNVELFKNVKINTYDYKRLLVSLYKNNLPILDVQIDIALIASLLEYNIKEDISYLGVNMGFSILENKLCTDENFVSNSINKARFINEVKDKLKEDLIKSKQEQLYSKIELPLSKTLAKMEYIGVRTNKNTLEVIASKLEEEISILETKIHSYTKEKFNIASPKQLGIVLFEELNLPYKKKKTTGYSTNIDVLEKLKNTHEIIPLIIEYRTVSKILSTYANGLTNYIKEDNKIHTIYTQTITRTGRLSSIEPNLQNIPTKSSLGKTIKKAFVSNNGLLISADYSQIELRMLAHLSNNQDIIDIFNSNEDIHSTTASKIFNLDINELTSEHRRKAKVINFGILYGMSNYGLAEELSTSMQEAKEFMDAYYSKFKGIEDYLNNLVEEATKLGYSSTMFGRVRHIKELSNPVYLIKEQGKRMALNTPIQGSSADIMKMAMNNVSNKIDQLGLKSQLVMQVHDELIIDAFKEEEQQIRQLLKEEMENVFTLKVKLETDINTGENWYEIK